MSWKEYPDAELMAMSLADILSSELNSALMTHDRVSLCVPGGTTPGPVFDTLSGVDLDWARVTVLLTDERWVAEDSPRSNARLVRERLLVNHAARAGFMPFWLPDIEPEPAAEQLSAALAEHLPISVLVLGMGADMHTASLFPGSDGLDKALSADAPPLMVIRPPGVDETRLTLTAPVLAGALSTHVLITGAEKRAAIERARDLPANEAPIRAVLSDACVHWAA